MTPSTAPAVTWLVAQRANWERLGDKFSGSNLRWQTEDALGLAALVGAGVALVLGLRWLSRWAPKAADPASPGSLRRRLAAAHRLSRAERRWLAAAVTEHGGAKPEEAFVRPELFDSAPPPGVPGQAWGRLGERLFGPTNEA